ncbi:LysR family transcriptional regulator [Neokomagataea thailandica NBRC 106555]|uniref:LysR family transcriptional regulator n=2 Tax=Neokomagataea TaxID=1223423 RepID=A0A4Y6V9G9_9PROT|nr:MULTISPECIES: LysR family transcriptional regulator [Neokomagataea]QDH25310.1 LysR family transcriptional regulator [Neokomagataea tanensis]GBR52488.1 LysR family transcriptional regulator [Neokomagataea thailandica NBRC 106555]
MRLPDFEGWAIFAKVAERGSFTRAADELQLSKPTVSKAVSRLEQSLGVALFSRNSRQMSLTEVGRSLIGHANRIIAEAEAAENEAKGGTLSPSGLIRVTAPMAFGIKHIAPLLPEFLTQYPDIDVNIDFSDSLVDLVAEGYDVALRIASLADSALRVRRLCGVRLMLVAAPQYLEQIGYPKHPRELADFKSFVYTNNSAPGMLRLRHQISGREHVLAQQARMRSDNAEAFLPAVEAGLGFGLFPEFMIWEGLRDGRLIEILPEWRVSDIALYLVMSGSALRPVRVSAFLDYMTKAFEEPLWCQR